MTPEEWQKIKDVLQTVLELDPSVRGKYLDDECARQGVNRSEIEELLRCHEGLGNFLEEPIAIATADLVLDKSLVSWVGRRLGPYQIVEKIGEGGMGAVFRAKRADGLHDNAVAIKVIRHGLDTSFFIERFRNESRILAGLEHPNIARLLDGGLTEEGLPYVILENVVGVPIDEYCDRHDLSIDGRLKLFRTICSAVQYAHQNLVVHRDLKPANILVTADGVTKLLDFGIAKILDPQRQESSADRTITILRMLTPDFASPEQLRGDTITTGSDVYSLGVILYLLLSGKPPYRVNSSSLQEMIKAVCETEPEKPSSAALRADRSSAGEQPAQRESSDKKRSPQREVSRRTLSKDLDGIVLKALRKEPARRYGTVEQFSDDIRRYLDHLPVTAQKDTLAYRTSKFVTRHKAGVAAVLSVVVILLASLLITLQEARIAQRRFNDVRELANSLVFDIHDSIKDLPGATHAREVLVQKASDYLDRLEKESGNDPTLQRELASAYERLGSVQGRALGANLGDSAGALRSYRKALNIEERLFRAGLTQDRLRYAKTGREIATILWATSDTTNALKSAQNSLEITKALSGKEPGNQEVLAELSADYVLVGDLMTGTSGGSNVPDTTNQATEDNYRRALEIDTQLAANSSDPKRRRNLVVDELYIGRHFNDTGRWQEAITAFNEAIMILQKNSADSNDSAQAKRDLAAVHNNLGDTFLMSGNASHALPEYEEALRIISVNALADPADMDAQALVAEAEMNVGNALRKLGRNDPALSHLHDATQSLTKAANKDLKNQAVRRDLVVGYLWSARALANKRDFVAALEDYNRALATQKPLVRLDPRDLDNQDILAGVLAAEGDFFQERGQVSSAEENYRQVLTIGESLLAKAPDKEEMRYVMAQAYLGLAQLEMSRAVHGSERVKERSSHWSQARTLVEQSSNIYRQISHPAAVTANGLDALDEGEIARVMSRCDTALAELTASSP
jgi:eukaryotic-like serine/threonine-protein kinase